MPHRWDDSHLNSTMKTSPRQSVPSVQDQDEEPLPEPSAPIQSDENMKTSAVLRDAPYRLACH
jgi:hypothetical protein